MTDMANKTVFNPTKEVKELKTPTRKFINEVSIITILAIFGYYVGVGDIGGAISALIIAGFIWWSYWR